MENKNLLNLNVYMKREIVKGKIINIKNYGVFVKLKDNRIGLCHIQEISDYYVSDITKFFELGSTYEFEILGVKDGKLSLSYKSFRPEMLEKFIPEPTKSDFKNLINEVRKEIAKY